MKVLSLFDGISCGQVALHRAGFKPSLYMASEINKSAIKCTMSNFPATVQLGDVINVRQMAEAGAFGVGQIDFRRGFTIPPMTIDSANFLMGFSPDQWRILSVAECERLQTLPTGYTRAIGTGEAYHGIGNGWTVDVVAHIFKGMHS